MSGRKDIADSPATGESPATGRRHAIVRDGVSESAKLFAAQVASQLTDRFEVRIRTGKRCEVKSLD